MTEVTPRQQILFTKHALIRMSQRKIPASYVRRVFAYGTPTRDFERNADTWTVDFWDAPDATWAKRLSGIVVVADGLKVITTWIDYPVRSQKLGQLEIGV